jgi:pimeloyl-ACP methyl ester carboxylesterase
MNKIVFSVVVAVVAIELWYYKHVHYDLVPALSAKKSVRMNSKGPFELFGKTLDMIDDGCITIGEFFDLAFRQTSTSRTKKPHFENICSFFSWAVYGSETWQLNPVQSTQIHDFVQHIQKRFHITFSPGFNVYAKHIRHSLEDIQVYHRPLISYGFKFILDNLFVRTKMHSLGFKRHKFGILHYWIHPASSKDAIVFFHGISSGLFNYMNVMSVIREVHPNKTVFLIEYPWILMCHHFNVPEPNKFAQEVQSLLHMHGFAQASFMGHSFGTALCACVHTRYPDIVKDLYLLDPVCLILPLPFVAFNFLYREPTSLKEWGIYNLFSREISISHVLRRHFEWSDYVLYIDDITPDKSVHVFLAENDEVNCAKTIQKYLSNHKNKNNNVRVTYKTNMVHADVLHKPNEAHAFFTVAVTTQ